MSNIDIVQGTATWLPFIASDVATGAPRTGILFSQVNASLKEASQSSFSSKTLTSPTFRENGNGIYEIYFITSELDETGSFLYVVNGNSSLPSPAIRQYIGQANIVASPTYTPGAVVLPTNVITGNLVDLQGVAIEGVSVSAKVLSAPSIQGSVSPNIAGVGTSIISARTDSYGFFALELIQGALVDLVIPHINYRRTLTVPANATDVLWDIP